MTVDVMWMRCLGKRDHVIPDESDVLGAGYLKALCDARVYPLRVSTGRTTRRGYCRACIGKLRAEVESRSGRIPDQEEALRVVSEMSDLLTVIRLRSPHPRGTPV